MPEPKPQGSSFAGLPARPLDEVSGAGVAVLGIAEASPYEPGKPRAECGSG